MLLICKKNAPVAGQLIDEERRRLANTPGATVCYDNIQTAVKSKILCYLLDDQNYLCAYCMRKIYHPNCSEDCKKKSGSKAHIEHYLVRNPSKAYRKNLPSKMQKYDENAYSLRYENLLAVCSGGEISGQKSSSRCCDKSRKDSIPLRISPLDRVHIDTLFYRKNGEIGSKNDAYQSDIVDSLRLNSDDFYFCLNRKAVRDTIAEKVVQHYGKRQLSRDEWTKFKNYLIDSGWESREYYGVVEWWVNRKIAKAK